MTAFMHARDTGLLNCMLPFSGHVKEQIRLELDGLPAPTGCGFLGFALRDNNIFPSGFVMLVASGKFKASRILRSFVFSLRVRIILPRVNSYQTNRQNTQTTTKRDTCK